MNGGVSNDDETEAALWGTLNFPSAVKLVWKESALAGTSSPTALLALNGIVSDKFGGALGRLLVPVPLTLCENEGINDGVRGVSPDIRIPPGLAPFWLALR